ncbi:Peptide chain release factor 1, mitochondrial [Nakaseomyces bracarensis]|uniref:Peptide chain release factor 1, mitochondrial n=1 Tax=Nakaseomyces bracarensis TaxID=273131 RepID=A0ABR4NZS8_9SACH
MRAILRVRSIGEHSLFYNTAINIAGSNKYKMLQTRYNSSAQSDEIGDFTEINPKLLQRAQNYTNEIKGIEKDISSGYDSELQKRYSTLISLQEVYEKYQQQVDSLHELKEMVEQDQSLADEASEEIKELLPNLRQTSSELLGMLIPAHPFADKACMLELRPGVGGVEAMIFAQDLLNMYISYAHNKKWKYHLVSKRENESGSGVMEAVLAIDEPGAYNQLKYEAGVHRVQRIPATESKGRVHTSTAAVIVLPQLGDENGKDLDAYERSFTPEEIRIDVKRASGKGGQHVNTTESAVRLTHIPTGIMIHMQDERSQHRNKAKAFSILRSKLAELERQQKEEEARNVRKEQVTTMDRSDKIRTYNFTQNRITDHRCGFNLYALDGVMAGERLDEVIDANRKYDDNEQAKRLLAESESSS